MAQLWLTKLSLPNQIYNLSSRQLGNLENWSSISTMLYVKLLIILWDLMKKADVMLIWDVKGKTRRMKINGLVELTIWNRITGKDIGKRDTFLKALHVVTRLMGHNHECYQLELEQLVTMDWSKENSREKQRKKMCDGLAQWLWWGQVTDAWKAMKDQEVWMVLVT